MPSRRSGRRAVWLAVLLSAALAVPERAHGLASAINDPPAKATHAKRRTTRKASTNSTAAKRDRRSARAEPAAAATTTTHAESVSAPDPRALAPGFDPACPSGKVASILACPEMVCPCQRGRNVVLARAFDPRTRCCNAPSCDEICARRSRCPRFECPCGVPGDRAAATDEDTGECITDAREVCRRACNL
ncbi:MAG TPA: hypothetical protein VFD92_19130 [Candidatus Binatia bacterium]|nr:hypothetical protein [Candidatus Binatia bacterium]